MKRLNTYSIRWNAILALIPFVLATSPIYAAGLKEHIKPVTNIGFMNHPPKAWVQRFPMCDAFLKVKWVDVKKEVGYSVYNLYLC